MIVRDVTRSPLSRADSVSRPHWPFSPSSVPTTASISPNPPCMLWGDTLLTFRFCSRCASCHSITSGFHPCSLVTGAVADYPIPDTRLEQPPTFTTPIGPRTGPCDCVHPLLRCSVVFRRPCDRCAQALYLGLRRRLRVRQGVGRGALLACGLCGRRHGGWHRSVLVSRTPLQTRADADRRRSCLPVHRIRALRAVPSGSCGCGAAAVGTGYVGPQAKRPLHPTPALLKAPENSTQPCAAALWRRHGVYGRACPGHGGSGLRPGRCA